MHHSLARLTIGAVSVWLLRSRCLLWQRGARAAGQLAHQTGEAQLTPCHGCAVVVGWAASRGGPPRFVARASRLGWQEEHGGAGGHSLTCLLQMVGTLKMNGTARTGAFTADGTQLLTSGGDGTGTGCCHGRRAENRLRPPFPSCSLACGPPRRSSHAHAVYVWDLRTQRCLQRHQDEGCLNGASMACASDGTLFATGGPGLLAVSRSVTCV